MVDWSLIPAFVLNGIVLGSILALAATGLTLVYGILNLSNFAHGDFLTLGAYAAFFFNVTLVAQGGSPVGWTLALAGALALAALVDLAWPRRLERAERGVLLGGAAALALVALARGSGLGLLSNPMLLPILLAVVVVPIAGVLFELAIWKPLRRRRATVLTLIIVSIGLALALRHVLVMYFGSSPRIYERETLPPYRFAGLTLTEVQLTIIVVAALLILGLHVLLRYTRIGKALRALSDNMELARVSGIDVDRMILYVWILSGALAGVAGVLLAMNTQVHPSVGWNLILPIFAAVILGGIGSAYGAMAGGIALGVTMEVSVAWNPNYRFAVAFLGLILILLLRPQGILGGGKA